MEFTQDADENGGHFHKIIGPRSPNPAKGIKISNPSTTPAISKKKILAEKNDSPFSDPRDLYHDITPQENAMVVSGHPGAHSRVMPLCSKVSNSGDQNAINPDCSQAPYDPLINYTSPRPEFLRYNPNRRQEILQRIEGEMKIEEEGSGAEWSSSSDSKKTDAEESSSVSSTPLKASFQDKEVQETEEVVSDAEDDDTEEEEEVEVMPWYYKIAWRLLLLLGVLLPLFFHISYMNYASVVPSLEEYGGLEENYQMIRDGGPDQRAHNLNRFPGNFWGILMGLSNVCFNIHSRELTCAFDGFKREVPEEEDLEEGTSIIYLRSLIEDEKLNEKRPTLEDAARKDASEEKKSFDGTELITERERDASHENRTLGGVDLVAEKTSEEVVSSNEIEQEAYIEGNTEALKDAGREKVEILGVESMEVHNIAQLLKESSQVAETESVAIDSSFGQDALDVCGSFEPKQDPGREAQVMGNSDFDECLHIPRSKIAEGISSNNQKLEESEVSSNSDIELKWDSIYLFASKCVLQLLYFLTCMSTIIVFGGFLKYLKFHKTSAPESRIPPALKRASELALEKNKSAKEEVEDKDGDSDVHQMPLTHLNDEQMKSNGVQPPTVELLAEFSVVEGTIRGKGSGQKVRRSAEELQFFQSQRKISVKKNLPSSANKVYPSPFESSLAAESISTRYSPVRKLQKKKDAEDREEVVKQVTTPLRRSSRLRSRVTSP
ncbi:hypothetical protein COCNU_06G004540 [Cocos nucifera]|uniref:Uncharacterized protein n=1 Tax=Cocos nucifera TaxID=13894 RepID=A0A8K0IB10_COCNU|nr:hypothetical protein COCNU_06G004540 [Cocos nucifera]